MQTSRVRTVHLLPAILGSVCLFIALDALRAARAHLDAARLLGGRGEREPGLWLLGIGVVGFLLGVGAGPLLA